MKTKNITAESKLNIGITFFVSHQFASIFSNGTIQNVLFLHELFKASPRVGEVYLINGGDSDEFAPGFLPPSMQNIKLVRPTNEVLDQLDVIIDFHVQLETERFNASRERGLKLVQYKSGNVYVMEVENSIFNLDRPNAVVTGERYDEIWTLPHHAKTNRYYLQTIYRAPVYILPYLWDPVFINYHLHVQNLSDKFFYQPHQVGSSRKNIAIFEPNFNIVKTCHMSLLVCEEAYRQRPEVFGHIFVNNIEHMRQQKNFNFFTQNLDITRDKIASYEGRYDVPFFMSNHANMVVTNNWENGLNNLYFDILYGGYPLIHNSEFLKGVGYYYEIFNTVDGARALLEAVDHHDQRFESYMKKNRLLFDHLSPKNPKNIDAHVNRLFALFGIPANH